VIGCYLLSRSCFAHMPIARSDASVSNLSGSLLLKDTKTGGLT
jgi:hypothetical protein